MACLPSTRILIWPGKTHSNLPFGPSIRIEPSSETAIFTLSGISIAFLPIRDIENSLPDQSQQFTADVLFARLATGDNSPRRRKDCHAHSTEHPRNFA